MDIYEQLALDELENQGLTGFTPHKDRGVDCVVLSKDLSGKAQRLQIKGNRTYANGGAWYQVARKNLDVAHATTDFWVFVSMGLGKRGRFLPTFLVVPATELQARLSSYSAPSGGKYNVGGLYT
jgi:hypothetical protein